MKLKEVRSVDLRRDDVIVCECSHGPPMLDQVLRVVVEEHGVRIEVNRLFYGGCPAYIMAGAESKQTVLDGPLDMYYCFICGKPVRLIRREYVTHDWCACSSCGGYLFQWLSPGYVWQEVKGVAWMVREP